MAKKIGEFLLEKGLITQAQLDTALKNQLILGGHLGTCLLELGFIGEHEFGQALSQLLGIPYAPRSLLSRPPEHVVCAMPKRLVAECRAVPIDLREHTLHVAMADPRNLRALDVLAFGTGYKISAWIAPEVRILEAMERLYNIPRTTRYIAIARTMQSWQEEEESAAGSRSSSKVFGETYISGTARDVEPANFGAEFGYGRSWVEVAEELCGAGGEADSSPAGEESDPPARHEAPEGTRTLSEVAARLCATESKEQIASAVLDFASATMPRAILLAVREGNCSVLGCHGFSAKPGGHPAARIRMEDAGVFELLQGSDHYRGPVPDQPRHLGFYAALGADPPAEIFLAPVHINDRLVAVMLGDGGPHGRISGDTEDYLRMVRMLALSLSLLVLKKKIRAIESFASPPGRPSHPRIVVAGGGSAPAKPPGSRT